MIKATNFFDDYDAHIKCSLYQMLILNDDRENDKGTLFGWSLPRWYKQVLGLQLLLLCSDPRSAPDNQDEDHDDDDLGDLDDPGDPRSGPDNQDEDNHHDDDLGDKSTDDDGWVCLKN